MKLYQYDSEQRDQLLNDVFHSIINCLSQEEIISPETAYTVRCNYVIKPVPLSWFGNMRKRIWKDSKEDSGMICLLKVVNNNEVETKDPK